MMEMAERGQELKKKNTNNASIAHCLLDRYSLVLSVRTFQIFSTVESLRVCTLHGCHGSSFDLGQQPTSQRVRPVSYGGPRASHTDKNDSSTAGNVRQKLSGCSL